MSRRRSLTQSEIDELVDSFSDTDDLGTVDTNSESESLFGLDDDILNLEDEEASGEPSQKLSKNINWITSDF